MGKAVVYSHLGNGKYSILYTPEVTAVDAEIEKLEDHKEALDTQMFSTNGLIEAETAALEAYNKSTLAFFATLDDWAACARLLPPCSQMATLMSYVMERGTKRAEAGAALTIVRRAISENRAEYFATTQQIAYLNNTKKGSGAGLMEVWCIDYDPTNIIPTNTIVGTIETFGSKGGYAGGFLPRKWVNIQSSANSAYNAARDHCIKPLSGIKTAAMFFNWCQWLYVMSRNPQHAVGVVLSKFDPDQTYLDVDLFGTTPGASQPGGYPFNGDSSLTLLNVPVNYLSCGAKAFEAGDKAIIRFSGINRESPVVIGFAENPAACQVALTPLVRTIFPGGSTAETRIMGSSCTTEFTPYSDPDYTSIGWLDWIDTSGLASLWLQVSGPLGKYRYGKFITYNPAKRIIYQAGGAPITVGADVFGMTKYNGVVYYVTKTATDFELRKTDETVMAAISLASILAEIPVTSGVPHVIGRMMDGWFKFSASGALGVTLVSCQKYLLIELSTTDSGVEAEFSIEVAPISQSFVKTEAAWTDAETFYCPMYYTNTWTGNWYVWALDFIGDTLNYFIVDTYTESLSLPVVTYGCTDNHTCFWRRLSSETIRYRIATSPASEFNPSDEAGVLAKQKIVTHKTHYMDWVPEMDGTGELKLSDLDIRRKAAAFVGTLHTVTGPSTADLTLNAMLCFGGVQQRYDRLTSSVSPVTFINAVISQDGGFLMGGAESPPCEVLTNISNTAADKVGTLIFTAPFRADIFSVSNSDALFFIKPSASIYAHRRFCGGAFTDANSAVGQMPSLYGYPCVDL